MLSTEYETWQLTANKYFFELVFKTHVVLFPPSHLQRIGLTARPV